MKLGTVLEVRVQTGARAGDDLYFFDPDHVRIGRSPGSEIVLPDAVVSRQHAEVRREGDHHVLWDLGSSTGTWLWANGERVQALALSASPVEVVIGQGGPRCRIGIGRVVPFGRYLLTGRLGGGGMAEIYMARQTGPGGFNRPVAIKLIQPAIFDLVDAASMFLDEARIAAEINHHNVIKIYEVGEQGGVLYIAMEYLRGITLSNLVSQLAQRGERMPPDLVAALLSQACSGLQAAHQLRDASGRNLNVVHRDVSPANLMCLPEGLVKVIDFGVARAEGRLHKTEQGLQGKPAYMSPEAVQSLPVDCRADIFAIGVVIYELCTGQHLFLRDDTVATLFAVMKEDVPPLDRLCPAASPLLAAVAKRALAKDPRARYQTAAELAAELDRVVLEAGGRFTRIAAIARYLSEQGVNLIGVPPSPLTQVPRTLQPQRSRPPRPQPPVERDPSVTPEISLATATFDGVVPNADVAQAVKLAPLPLGEEPHRLCGSELCGRYLLLRWLGQSPAPDRPYLKLYYLAQLSNASPLEVKARAAGLLPDGQVVVALCGSGETLQSLDALARERLHQFADQRAWPDACEHLVPVLAHGEAGEGGPTYLVMPYYASKLDGLLSANVLTLEERLQLARQLSLALAQAVRCEPSFLHGDLNPRHIAVQPRPVGAGAPAAGGTAAVDGGALQVVLLDFNLDTMLEMEAAPLPQYSTLPLTFVPYVAPERLRGEPCTQAADVFAIGAIIYELLGGDLQRAAQNLRRHSEPPPLPTQQGLPAYIESAIMLALRPDPAQRPDAAQLLQMLTPSATAKSDDYLRVAAPEAGKQAELQAAGGRHVVLSTLWVRALQQHKAVPLPLSQVSGLLPVPLSLVVHGDSLSIEIEAGGARGRDRPSLYHDAYDPNTRSESYTIPHNQPSASFDVGHRRSWVQRIFYNSVYIAAPDGILRIAVPELRLEIEVAAPVQRLVSLYTVAPQKGTVHLLCIAVQMD